MTCFDRGREAAQVTKGCRYRTVGLGKQKSESLNRNQMRAITESGEMQVEDEQPTIEAFKQLSLQRDRRAEIRAGRGMPRGKAQGLRGLATGGRAGMAKRNLAGLAPDFIKQSPSAAASPSASSAPSSKPVSKLSALAARSSAKRPAENPPADAASRARPASPAPSPSPATSASPTAPVAPAAGTASVPPAGRTSKLAALAAARSSASATATKPVPSAAKEPSTSTAGAQDAPTKSLSKLQQRMLANKQQRQAAKPEAKEATAAQAAEEEARSRPQTCFGSDLPISSLFPAAESAPQTDKVPAVTSSSGTALASISAIAGSSKDATDQLVAPLSMLRRVPGGSPFALYVPGSDAGSGPAAESVRKAFAGPSPDDVVLKAREGTRLGAK